MTTQTQPRQLSLEMQTDVPEAFAGKLWAYTAVVGPGFTGLGVAVANEPGYSPINAWHYAVDRYDEAEAEAERLNTERGLTREQVIEIVLSSMAAGKVA